MMEEPLPVALPEPSAEPATAATALTPEQRRQLDAEDVMAAAMEAANARGRHDPTADQALMGANNEGVDGLEATDENGELVREEFVKFLQE